MHKIPVGRNLAFIAYYNDKKLAGDGDLWYNGHIAVYLQNNMEVSSMKRKIIALCLIVAMLGVAVIGGTMAYFTDTAEAVNVMTIGSVKIEQIEQERNAAGELVPFTQAKPLLPYVGNLGWANTTADNGAFRTFTMKNVVDKIVQVENTGRSDAYVRTIFAFEVGEYTKTADLWYKVLGISNNAYNGSEFKFDGAWAWSDKMDDSMIVEINGNNYLIVTATHLNAVKPGETTIPSLLQVYMSKDADNEEAEKLDGNKNGTYDILVISQAIQASGFSDAMTALNADFGEVTTAKAKEWFGDLEIPVLISSSEDLVEVLTAAGAANAGDTVIALASDLDMTGKAWTPIKVDGYHGADIVTIDGQGHTIKGLTAPLFAGGFAGGSGIVIKNLTIADSTIVSSNTIGSGAFIESCDSMDTITLENCHLVNSKVSGSRTGGLLGWTAGYSNQNDGPVKTYVTIRDCSVKNCEITGSSVGAINGHAGNNDWTYTTIENCEITNNILHSTDDGDWRVGVVVGTANVGEVTINNITESGNTLTQVGKTAPAGQSNLYGRFVPVNTGKLVIDGVEID